MTGFYSIPQIYFSCVSVLCVCGCNDATYLFVVWNVDENGVNKLKKAPMKTRQMSLTTL